MPTEIIRWPDLSIRPTGTSAFAEVSSLLFGSRQISSVTSLGKYDGNKSKKSGVCPEQLYQVGLVHDLLLCSPAVRGEIDSNKNQCYPGEVELLELFT